VSYLDIAGMITFIARKYCEWLQSYNEDITLKDEVRKACGVVLTKRLDPRAVYTGQEFSFLKKKGRKLGIARRYVSDIRT
jgi:hypothetical protein